MSATIPWSWTFTSQRAAPSMTSRIGVSNALRSMEICAKSGGVIPAMIRIGRTIPTAENETTVCSDFSRCEGGAAPSHVAFRILNPKTQIPNKFKGPKSKIQKEMGLEHFRFEL